MMLRPQVAAVLAAALALTACDDEQLLTGERLNVRDPLPEAVAADAEGREALEAINAAAPAPDDPKFRVTRVGAVAGSAPIRLAAQVNHTTWSHRGGGPDHRIQHPALGTALTQVWAANIGQGNSRRARITADPVASGGRIYTLDASATVSAVSSSGAVLWQQDLTPPTDRNGDASGGGLALGTNRLYVATGFGRLHAIDTITGKVLWEQQFDAPVGGAPTVVGDLIYVTSRDSRAFAVRAETGRLAWELPGAPSVSVTVNGAGPAVSGGTAIFPFGSAELVATLRQGGVRTWSATLAGERRGRAYAGYTDVTGDPVVVGDRVYAGSPSGRVAALNLRSGERIWTATEGALSPIVPAGDSLFLVSDQGQLVRLSAEDGTVVWSTDMPFFTKEKARRRLAVVPHYGPVLAGGQLWVGSGDGVLRAFDPRDGGLQAEVPLAGGGASNPIVVDRTLYVISGRGQLLAYR